MPALADAAMPGEATDCGGRGNTEQRRPADVGLCRSPPRAPHPMTAQQAPVVCPEMSSKALVLGDDTCAHTQCTVATPTHAHAKSQAKQDPQPGASGADPPPAEAVISKGPQEEGALTRWPQRWARARTSEQGQGRGTVRGLESNAGQSQPGHAQASEKGCGRGWGGQNSASRCQVWESGPRAPPGALAGRGREIAGSLPEARRVWSPHSPPLSPRGHVLGEVAHLPPRKHSLSCKDERVLGW